MSGVCRTKFSATLAKADVTAQAAGTSCRYIDNGDGTISDLNTGLIWEKKDNLDGAENLSDPHDADNPYRWTATAAVPDGSVFTDFLGALNGATSADGVSSTGCFTGHCDWRLPTIEELQNILDPRALGCGMGSLCIDPAFGPTRGADYWSATSLAGTPALAWVVAFSQVGTPQGVKTDGFFVRAVRGGFFAAGPPCPTTCPLIKGRYTLTTTGGAEKEATFYPFPFPAGATIVQDVDCGDANCVHQTAIPYPGGFSAPVFCVPALQGTVAITQSGCGVGEIDSDGGSDFTIHEFGDTSTNNILCNVPQSTCPAAGPAPDSSGVVDVLVGDGSVDGCAAGTANAVLTIPVTTQTWYAADGSCPDADGTYNPGTDTLLSSWSQTLDLTTDASSVQFSDFGRPGDGCSYSGSGPAGPYAPNSICAGPGTPMGCCTGPNTGTCSGLQGSCLDIGTQTISLAGSGTIFSSEQPVGDLLFETLLDATVTGPAPFGGAGCAAPPKISFGGPDQRCIIAP